MNFKLLNYSLHQPPSPLWQHRLREREWGRERDRERERERERVREMNREVEGEREAAEEAGRKGREIQRERETWVVCGISTNVYT